MYNVQLTISTKRGKGARIDIHKLVHVNSQDSLSSGSLSTLDQDEFTYVEHTHSVEILAGLDELRKSNTFCDVLLSVEGDDFPCHKVVLASFSSYFKAMFTSEMAESQQKEIVLNGVEASTLKLLLDYAYSARIPINKSNVQALLSAANLLEVLPVRDACCRFLERHMDETNSIGIHCFAEAHACENLQKKAKEFTLRYFSEVMKHEELLTLSQSKLIEFISSDHLNVEKEETVFEAVLLWLNQDSTARSEDFHLVLEQVRLPLISPYYLHDCIVPVPAVSTSTQCQKLIDEAKLYSLLPDRRHQTNSVRTRPRRSFGISEVVVAVGGEDDKVVLRSVECLDPVNDKWLTLACLPFAISKHGVVVTGQNILYVAGGEFPDGTASRSLWKYDPIFDQWHEMASMMVERSELGLAVLDGFIYAIGGWDGLSRLNSVEKYNPFNNTWEYVAPMKISLTSPAVVGHAGHLYVTGGAVLEDGDGIDLVQRFCPLTNVWSDMAHMLIARSGSRACVVNNLIYVIGGWHASTENTNKVEYYDPKKNEWRFCKPMLERRYQPGVAVVDGKIYVCGGEEGWDRYHDTVEYYDPETDQWLIAGVMQSARSWLCCATLRLPVDIRIKERS
ncbi:kelch-like protein 24 [Trichonephila clavata]|uniref:Kelch-like protein diablo n=1 Tax=Trichonephila clavata TaxID=2740835 RepID=A0A8X6K8L3_TRICU|nr:kelch-like protein 24 [Trichonephila clavata]